MPCDFAVICKVKRYTKKKKRSIAGNIMKFDRMKCVFIGSVEVRDIWKESE